MTFNAAVFTATAEPGARTLSRSAADFVTAIARNRKAPMRGKALAVSQPNQGRRG
jgi:hypothetical protein